MAVKHVVTTVLLGLVITALGMLGESEIKDMNWSPQNERVTELLGRFDDYEFRGEVFRPKPPVEPLKIYKKRIYTVQEGDTLSGIAATFYGDPGKWTKILNANSVRLPGPEYLRVGMELLIPN